MFAGTRVPLKNFIDYLEAGDSIEVFLDHFPSVTREQAVAALELVFAALSNRLEHIRPLLPQALEALQKMAPGELRVITGS